MRCQQIFTGAYHILQWDSTRRIGSIHAGTSIFGKILLKHMHINQKQGRFRVWKSYLARSAMYDIIGCYESGYEIPHRHCAKIQIQIFCVFCQTKLRMAD